VGETVEAESIEVTISGERYRLTTEQVEHRLEGISPERVRNHAVVVGDKWFPVKQAFEVVTGLDRLDFNTEQARSAFRRLGLEVRRVS
jgi:hypothetical protein